MDMDKLQWFKFTPSDWMMGKIMRCSETTQARFIRICCLYWNNECELSYEDAEIELEKEHLDILVKRKIINSDGEFINIGFLDIQHAEILETSNDKSKSGVIGNLKRWHPDIYKRFISKELSLDDALSIANGSHPDHTPIAEGSQNIADKSREEETREDKNRKDKDNLGSNEPSTPPPKAFNFKKSLIDYGFKEELVKDWIKVRKTKRSTNTETAFNGFINKVEASTRDKNEILTTCVEHSWTSYKDSWYDNLNKDNGNNKTISGTTSGGSRATSKVADSYE